MSHAIADLIALEECKTLEFKRNASSPKPILKSLVAFANTAGGRLIIGVDDEKRPVGVANPLDEEERLCSLIADSISPRLVPNIEIDEPLPKAVDEVMLFLKKHAFRGADLSEVHRKDVWSIPLGILREVIINALVHADYSQRGAPTRIVFLDDRIEVESPGILLSGLTIEDMKQGTSRIRNYVIARVFRELHLIEQWGTGVRRIFEEAKELGLPEPKIEEIGMRLRFTIYLSQSHIIAPTDKSPTQSPTQSNEKVRQLLCCLQNGEKSAGELREMLGLKHRPTFRENYLHPALKQGLIEPTIPDKPNSRLQKYRLVEHS